MTSPPISPVAPEAFRTLLDAETLSALMRSTWTWDDRALRKDLSQLLVDLSAADGEFAPSGIDPRIGTALESKALWSGATLAATVLGPKLLVESDNPLRNAYLDAAVDPARYARNAATARAEVADGCRAYIDTHIYSVEYADETTWLPLVEASGARGVAAAMRAYGHDIAATSFFGNIALSWQALSAVPDSPTASEFAEKIVRGSLSAALAAAEQTGSWDPALVTSRAVSTSSGWQISGMKQFVPAASTADIILVIARSVAGPSLFAIEGSAPGVHIAEQEGIDVTRPLYEVVLSDAPARLIDVEGRGGRLMSEVVDLVTTALAAEQIGLTEHAIRMLVDAGSAAPAQLADRVLDHAAAMALWRRAVEAPSPAAAAAAHIGCSQVSVRAATALSQLGGPSKETDTVMRRALSASLLFGGPALAHERLLERLGL